MKKRTLTDSEVRLLLVFLALLMFACAYFLSFLKNVELAQEIEAQNEEDSALIETLESMIERKDQVEAQTGEYRQAIEDIVAKYPSDIPAEKVITIIQEIERNSGASVGNITFSMNEPVVSLEDYAGSGYTEEEEMIDEYLEDGDVEEEYLEENYTDIQPAPVNISSIGYSNTISMTYEAEYSALKRMIAYIEGMSDRTTISAITAAYDTATGNISGTMTVNMYYLTNTGREYEVPNITGVNKGVPDIFRSGGVSTTVAAPAESEEESEEEDGEEQENEESR